MTNLRAVASWAESEPFEIEDIFSSPSPELSQHVDALVERFETNHETKRFSFTIEADDEQRRFIKSDAEIIRLLAPAGSGKTQSIVNRIFYKASQGQSLKSFLVLTFDNAASLSLREKIATCLETLGLPSNETPDVLTLNKYGYQLIRGILRDRIGRRELGGEPAKAQFESIKRAMDTLKRRHPQEFSLLPGRLARRVYLDLISALKSNLLLPDKLLQRDSESILRLMKLAEDTDIFAPWLAGLPGSTGVRSPVTKVLTLLIHIYKGYEETNRDHNLIDFDDQKLLPFLELSADVDLARVATGNYKTVIVDEFQDINRLDFELISLLSERKSLAVIGDDDQCIYAFRGCSPDYIINLDKHLGRPFETHVLETNYRCPANVVEMGNRLIANNVDRVPKSQVADREDLADIKLWHCLNSASEAQIIARSIRKIYNDREGSGFRYSDIAILVRINSQSLPLQIALILEDIPYHCRKEDNLIVSGTMRKLLGLMRLHLALLQDRRHASPEDSQLLLECWFPYTDRDRVTRFHQLALEHGGYLGLISAPPYTLRALSLEKEDFRETIRELAAPLTPLELVQLVSKNFRSLGGIVGTLEDAINEHLPLGELIDIASRFKGSTLQFYRKMHGLLEKVENGLYHTHEGDAVNILTYFRAKGRQWDTVVIPGLNQRVIPLGNQPIEAERRLFYVAITRASSNLMLSYVRSAVGDRVDRSQFISEMGLTQAEEKRAGLIAKDDGKGVNEVPTVEPTKEREPKKKREPGHSFVQELLREEDNKEGLEPRLTPVERVIKEK
jgi:DNA helicase II / ATP-dependent DNA helicase PcrA